MALRSMKGQGRRSLVQLAVQREPEESLLDWGRLSDLWGLEMGKQ